MSQTETTKGIRYIIGTDGIRQMEGIADHAATIAAYRTALEAELAERYPGAEIEVGEEYGTRVDLGGEWPTYTEEAIRSIADVVLLRVLEA